MREDAPVHPDAVATDDQVEFTAESPIAAGTCPAPASATASDGDRDAVARRRTRARAARAWRWYTAALAVGLLVVAAFAEFTWQHGELRHVRSRTSTVPATALPQGALGSTLHPIWHSTDHAAIGAAVDKDVVVTYGGRTVSGRDAASGTTRWSYTRTDRRLCSAAAQADTVIAVYAHDGICDEATGLNGQDGKRVWTRTLLGSGGSVTVRAGAGYYLFIHPGSVNLVRPSQGTDSWNDIQATGCHVRSAVLGSVGVLFDSACTDGDRLILRKLEGDNRAWSVPSKGRSPLSADGVITALASDGRSLEILSPDKGAVTSRVKLLAKASPPASPQGIELTDQQVQLMAVAGATIGISTAQPPALNWQHATGSLNSTQAGVLVAQTGAVSSIAPRTGLRKQVSVVPGLVGDVVLWPLGTGLLADSPGGVTAYG